MKQATTRRGIRSSAIATLATAACLIVWPAGADDDKAYRDLTTLESTFELGFIVNSGEEYKFGDYTGLEDDGFSVLGNADVRLRSPYDAAVPYYVRLRGLNLGLDSRRIDAIAEMPGRFGLSFLFDELPKYSIDSASTPYRNLGGKILTLPPNWDPGADPTPAEMTELESSLRALKIDHHRQTYGGGLSLILMEGLDFDASYERQTKQGNKLTAGMFGINGGDPRAIQIPEPIDYVTHQIDSSLRYANEDVQLQLQYYGSSFDNETPWLRWQNPFTAAADYDPAQAYPAFGQKTLPPDNWFHQGAFSAGVNLPMNSRFMVNTAFGWGRQDEDFLPFALDPGFDNFTNLPLPRNDLNGKVRTGMASFRFTSNPLPKLGITLGYRWNERDNHTPVDTYLRVLADTGASGGDPDQDPENARINRPYSWDKQHIDADVSYRILKGTKLTLSYDWDQMDRDLQEVEHISEHTYGVKLVSRPHRRIGAGLNVQRAYRDGKDYDCVNPLVETEPPVFLADPGCLPGQDWENHPWLRKFNQADRRRTTAHLWATFAILDTLSLGVDSRYTHDDYFNSELGLTSFKSFASGFDLSYAPNERMSFHLFYQYDETTSEQDSAQWNPFAGPIGGNPFNPVNGWSSRDEDVFHTAGFGADLVAIPDRLTFGVEYLFTRSRGIVDTDVNSNLGPLRDFPDDITELHDVSLRSELQLTENFSVRLGYLYERYQSRAWATENVCVACLDFSSDAAVIATGDDAPDYETHLGSVSVILHFW